jgi:L-lactate dehydrogenase complex protein LldG
VVAPAVTTARDEVLGRIRTALGAGAPVPEIPRGYRDAGTLGAAGNDVAVERFCERAAEYRATVLRVERGGLSDAVGEACNRHGARRIAVPEGAPGEIPGVELVVDDPPLSARDLDGLDGVLTGCALAIAETGTIVLDGGARSGRRALTLVPDLHLCVVEAQTIVPSVPDAVRAVAQAVAEGRPITLVSGPSATSDIELDRVEGVHGPRRLEVFVVEA